MNDKNERLDFHDQLLYPRDPTETIGTWYTKWVHTYEKDLSAINYNGPQLVVKHFLELNLPKNIKLLDIAAGTGIVGCLLRDNGYTNIDALDGSPEMLSIARQRNCYQNIIESFITEDIRLPIEDQAYDHIILAGCLCPGHINYHSLPQIIRLCKRGGFICWSMALPDEYIERDPLFADRNFEKYIESLSKQNIWEFVPGFPKRVNNYSRGNDGWVYAMKVL